MVVAIVVGLVALIAPGYLETTGEHAVQRAVPGTVGDLTRFEHVVCTGLDRNGKKISLDGTGLFGRCLQHEMDHLNGVLYIDKAKNLRPAETDEEVAEAEAVAAGAR